jgi:hypothetical protein
MSNPEEFACAYCQPGSYEVRICDECGEAVCSVCDNGMICAECGESYACEECAAECPGCSKPICSECGECYTCESPDGGTDEIWYCEDCFDEAFFVCDSCGREFERGGAEICEMDDLEICAACAEEIERNLEAPG